MRYIDILTSFCDPVCLDKLLCLAVDFLGVSLCGVFELLLLEVFKSTHPRADTLDSKAGLLQT